MEAAELRTLAEVEDRHWWYKERRSLLARELRRIGLDDARGEIQIALAVGGEEPGALAALEAEIDPGKDGKQMRRGAVCHGNH